MNATQKRGTLKQVIELLYVLLRLMVLKVLLRFNQAIERPANWPWVWHKAGDIILSGWAIGSIFAMSLILISTNEPNIWAVCAMGTSLTLYICLSRLYSDPLFIFVGVIYLMMVGGVASTALFVGVPKNYILAVSIHQPSLIMLATLVAWHVFRQAFVFGTRFIRWFLGGAGHQQSPHVRFRLKDSVTDDESENSIGPKRNIPIGQQSPSKKEVM